MKLEEAIRIADNTIAPPLMHPESSYDRAIKLLIEAGKAILDYRKGFTFPVGARLPGETFE